MKQKQTIADIAGWIFLLLTILLGVALILQTATIYYDGKDAKENARKEARQQAVAEGLSEQIIELKVAAAASAVPIYSRAIVGEKLKGLLPYIGVWLAGLVALILTTVLTRPEKPKPARAPQLMLAERLKKQRKNLPTEPRDGEEAALAQATAAARSARRDSYILLAVTGVLAVVCLGVPLLYFLDFSHFPNENINKEVAGAVLFSLPFLVVMLAGALVATYLRAKLLNRESDAIKDILRAGLRPGASKAQADTQRPWVKMSLRLLLLVVGVGLVVLGYFNGSMSEVLEKATRICTECIGLG